MYNGLMSLYERDLNLDCVISEDNNVKERAQAASMCTLYRTITILQR